MDALSLIKENMTDELAVQILSSYGFMTNISGNQIRSYCKIHNGDNVSSFCYSLKNHMFYCFRCGAGGDIVQLVEAMENIDFKEACNKLLGFMGIDAEGLDYVKRNTQHEKDLKAFIEYSKRSEPKAQLYQIPTEPIKVTKYRHFAPEVLEHFSMGFIREMEMQGSSGTFKAYDRWAMPIIFNEEVVGYAFRKNRKSDNPKWLFQPYGLNKRAILYNLQRQWYNEIIVCEGIYDVWSWWSKGYTNAVCVFGSSITDEQLSLLQRCTCNIVLSFDGDIAGREATKKAIGRLKDIFDLRVIPFEDGKDPGDCTDELDTYYKRKMRWREWIKN